MVNIYPSATSAKKNKTNLERLSVLIVFFFLFSFFFFVFITVARLLVAWLYTTPPYLATRLSCKFYSRRRKENAILSYAVVCNGSFIIVYPIF